jgi:hypothetical protein
LALPQFGQWCARQVDLAWSDMVCDGNGTPVGKARIRPEHLRRDRDHHHSIGGRSRYALYRSWTTGSTQKADLESLTADRRPLTAD